MKTIYDNIQVGELVAYETTSASGLGQVFSITDTTIVLHTTDDALPTITFTKNAAGEWESDLTVR